MKDIIKKIENLINNKAITINEANLIKKLFNEFDERVAVMQGLINSHNEVEEYF